MQDARKSSGLQVSDRIELWWETMGGGGEVASAIAEHHDVIAGEVLAVAVTRGRPATDITPHSDLELGLTFWLRAAGR